MALLITAALPSVAQTINNPAVGYRDDASTAIRKIETNDQYTIVSFETTANRDSSWVQINKEIYLQTDVNNAHYDYVKSENIALAPVRQILINSGDKLVFKVYFKRIPSAAKYINIIERAGPNNGEASYFNYYNVSLIQSQSVDYQVKSGTRQYSLGTAVTIDSVRTQAPIIRINNSAMNNEFTTAMNAMGPMISNMAKAMMDTQLEYYKQPGKLTEVAKLNKAYYDALRKEGFSSDDALKIITSESIMPKPTVLNNK